MLVADRVDWSHPPSIGADRGAAPVTAFHGAPGMEVLALGTGGMAGFVRRGRWAVFPAEPISPLGSEWDTTAELLATMRARRLRPVFAAVRDADVLRRQGLTIALSAHDAIVDLTRFTLVGSRMASLRHSVAAAERAGLSVRPWDGDVDDQVRQVSRRWLGTKRGGEWGFTLGRVDGWSPEQGDGWVAVDRHGVVVAVVTWRRYDDGYARVLDLMRRDPSAPNPAMDYLLASCLGHYQALGVLEASLSAVPVQRLRAAERFYPTESLRRYKEKFAPTWVPLSLAAPSIHDLPAAARAVLGAFCDGGIRRMVRPNGDG